MQAVRAPFAVDGTTIERTAAGVVRVKPSGITATQLASAQRRETLWSTPLTDVLGSRARDVIYQNTGTTPRQVCITYDAGNANLAFQVDTVSPPVNVASPQQVAGGAGTKRHITFTVPAGGYYRVNRTSGTTDSYTGWSEANA